MQRINLSAIPSQVVNVTLANQNCEIFIFQKTYGLFVNITCNKVALVKGKIARNGVSLLGSKRLGFVGDLVFLDMQGQDDPDYTGLGDRFRLFYIEVTDV